MKRISDQDKTPTLVNEGSAGVWHSEDGEAAAPRLLTTCIADGRMPGDLRGKNRGLEGQNRPRNFSSLSGGKKITAGHKKSGGMQSPKYYPMNSSSCSPEMVLQELAAWCDLARDALLETIQPLQNPGLRALKDHLLRQHDTHLTELVERKGAGRESVAVGKRPCHKAWTEVFEAMGAGNEHVALSACALLERAVLEAYERASNQTCLDKSSMRLIRRQKDELKSCRDFYLRRMQSWRVHATSDREQAMDLGTLAASAV